MAVLLMACSGGGDGRNNHAVTLGIVQSLSGGGAVYGKSGVQGAELAIKDLEAANSWLQIDTIIDDDRGEISESVRLYTSLSERKVTAIIGPTFSTVAFQSLKASNERGIPSISPMTTASGIAAIGDYVFRIALAEEASLPALIKYISDRNPSTPIRQAALFLDSRDAYSRSAADAMRRGLAAVGGTVAIEVDLAANPNVATVAADARSREADVLLLPLVIEPAGALLKGLRDAGLQQPAAGGEALATLDLTRTAGQAAEGFYVASTWHPDVDNDLSRRFVSAYRAAYGVLPEHFAAETYVAIQVLVDAVRRADSTEPAKVRDAIAATRDLDTMLGKLSMSPEGDAVFEPVFQQFRRGRLVILE